VRREAAILTFAAACALIAGAAPAGAASSGFPQRSADPVVLDGSNVPSLIGEKPNHIVAFRFGKSGWHQVPIQVDERAVIDYAAVRQGNQTENRPFSHLAYTDPKTFAGADPDPTLDGNDEIAAMAKDSGRAATGRKGKTNPKGVVKNSRVKIDVKDPLQAKVHRYIYLFISKGKLKPAAGKDYVDYDFSLDSGDYKTTYDFSGVPGGDNTTSGPPGNPENSTVSTAYYSQHLPARWIEDQLKLKSGGSTGVDILDGDKAQVGTSCGRSELTFSRGGGGFIANKDGPVRAIRSYIGANSGTYTQQDHIYYQRSDVATTYLRVHAGISVITQFLDYSPAATGMKFRNSLNTGGVTIDGAPDTLTGGLSNWQQVTGTQGSAAIVSRVDTDVPGFTPTDFYEDNKTDPSYDQCSGYSDDEFWGASGTFSTSSGKNTDPTRDAQFGETYSLTGTRTMFYGAPGAKASDAALHSDQVDSPLKAKVIAP
jgi:hypothetical protein